MMSLRWELSGRQRACNFWIQSTQTTWENRVQILCRWSPGHLPNHGRHRRISEQRKVTQRETSSALSEPTTSRTSKNVEINRHNYCFLFFCLGSSVSSSSSSWTPSTSCGNRRCSLIHQLGRKNISAKKKKKSVGHNIRLRYLDAAVLLLQGRLQSGRVDAEVPGGALLHVLHQVDLDIKRHTHGHWKVWQRMCVDRPQFRQTFDFFESKMRNFSYCSMLKIKLGMALVSRMSLACHEDQKGKSRTHILFKAL